MTTIAEPAAVFLPPSALTLWARNPRENESAIEPVARSLLRFGFGAPIVARLEDRRVIAGHTRLAAFDWVQTHVLNDDGTWRERGANDGPCVIAGVPIGTVPVRLLDIGNSEANALALADNKLGELADWDVEGLASLFTDLGDAAEDLGWSTKELDFIIGDVENMSADTLPKGEMQKDPDQTNEIIADVRIPVECTEALEGLRKFAEHWSAKGVTVSIA